MSVQIKVSEKISLESLSAKDAPELFQCMDRNRAHLKQWLPWLDHNKVEADSHKFIESSIEGEKTGSTRTMKIVYEGRLVGVVSHHPYNKANRALGLGYWLDEKHQGKGIVSESVKAFVKYLFKGTGVHRIELACATGNKGSNGIARRLGFKFEGVRRDAEWLYDHFVDHNVYALLRSDGVYV